MNVRIGNYRYEAYADRNYGSWRPYPQRYYSGKMLKVTIGPVTLTLARWPLIRFCEECGEQCAASPCRECASGGPSDYRREHDRYAER